MSILLELDAVDRLSGPVCFVDARIEADYAEGHIPGALHLDTFEFANERTEGAELANVLAAWHAMFLGAGLRPDENVVFYDAGTENRSARPAVMLRALGHERTHVLHGGMAAWLDAGRPASTGRLQRPASAWPAGDPPAWLVGFDAVVDVLARPEVVLLDVRSDEEYAGTKAMQGNPRLGRIPGARHLEWRSLIERRASWPVGTGTPRDGDTLLFRFLADGALRERFAAAGVGEASDVVLYCQKSHRASVVYVALEALGLASPKLYAGSFREWSRRVDAPVAS